MNCLPPAPCHASAFSPTLSPRTKIWSNLLAGCARLKTLKRQNSSPAGCYLFPASLGAAKICEAFVTRETTSGWAYHRQRTAMNPSVTVLACSFAFKNLVSARRQMSDCHGSTRAYPPPLCSLSHCSAVNHYLPFASHHAQQLFVHFPRFSAASAVAGWPVECSPEKAGAASQRSQL